MRIRFLGFFGLMGVLAMPAYAAGPAHSSSYESGVHVYRGNHGAPVSTRALEYVRLEEQQAASARQLAASERLAYQLAAQSAQIQSLQRSVERHKEKSHARKRRRTYYGNPAFFGRNGFYGNRNFSGAAPVGNRHRHRPYKKR